MPRSKLALILAAGLLAACPASDDPGGDDTDASGSSGISVPTSGQTTTDSPTTGTSVASGSAAEGSTESTAGDDTGPIGPSGPTECVDGMIYQCGDGEDNDDDGLVDLADPECTGPCDNDEGSFQTGLPGDNVDCFQDCFFDGDSGHEDNCWWNVTCDPANPGEGGICEYRDTPMCNMQPPVDTSLCEESCLPGVPNGCDCYGCCTVVVDGEEVNIWLGSGPDCSVDNIEACSSCTPNEDCGNPCNPDACEICVGGELPEGCDEPGCDNGTPCTVDASGADDCPDGFFCLSGCCTDFTPVG